MILLLLVALVLMFVLFFSFLGYTTGAGLRPADRWMQLPVQLLMVLSLVPGILYLCGWDKLAGMADMSLVTGAWLAGNIPGNIVYACRNRSQ